MIEQHPERRNPERRNERTDLVIFSIGVRHRTIRPVEFVCPRCGLDRTGTVLSPVRWAQVARLPVVPLGERGDVVACDDCGHESDLGVLDVPTTEQLARLLEQATAAAVATAVRINESSDRARRDEVRRRAVQVLTDAGYRSDDARIDGDVVGLDSQETRRRLAGLASELTPLGKQSFLHRITSVATGGGRLADDQRAALVEVGNDLGMASAHVNGVLAVAAARADA